MLWTEELIGENRGRQGRNSPWETYNLMQSFPNLKNQYNFKLTEKLQE